MSEGSSPRRPSTTSGTGCMEQLQLPSAASSGVDARVVSAWCEWLDALATDAEAALAAAMAYKQLDARSRDRWLAALEQDAARVRVPRIAVYAPLLAVESDPERRARIAAAIGPADAAATPRAESRALRGVGRDGLSVGTIVSPLYLDFVQVLACGFRAAAGFEWVRHDPIVAGEAAPRAGDTILGVKLEATPVAPLVDDLALAVLSHRRGGRELPEALKMFADLFGPVYSGAAPAVLP